MPGAPVLDTTGFREVELIALAARTASGTGAAVTLGAEFAWITFELVFTAANILGVDSIQVWVQQSLDGANWDDVVAFNPVIAGFTGGVFSASLPVRERDAAGELHEWRDTTLAGGSVAAFVLGRRFRAKWVFTGAPTGTFQVVAFPRA